MAGYNELKLRTLELFTRSGPIRPGEYMVRARFYPVEAADAYLRKLTKMGLLKRRRDARGHYLYMISHWGELRLQWLRQQLELTGRPGTPRAALQTQRSE